MTSSNTAKRCRPSSLARYIAASASRMRSSGSRASSPPSAMPIEADTTCWLPPSTSGSASASSIRVATAPGTAESSMSVQRTTNSSPPNRATVSPDRMHIDRRTAAACSSWSPTPWPSESLISLNWSTSMNSTATELPRRRACVIASSRRSTNRVRFGRPVSGSWRARWRISCAARSRSAAPARRFAIDQAVSISSALNPRGERKPRPRAPNTRPCSTIGTAKVAATPASRRWAGRASAASRDQSSTRSSCPARASAGPRRGRRAARSAASGGTPPQS